ncbi:MAG: hypothetical protein FWB85_03445 [Chitinispirillia bacterium]|nr:hypothetical protein [Chitinispirillia bacterium]MCL2241466.1 hypothetical protein [Chitinispirillia bacterium]
MLMTFDEVSKRITAGELLHIAGTEALLRKLPKGNWAGGSTEYFMDGDGGKVSGDLLFVTGFPYTDFAVKSYGTDNIKDVAVDAYDNGFSILIVPFDSAVHKMYAEKAPGFEDLFIKNIAGWIAGANLGKAGQTPIAVNGLTGEAHSGRAAALHIGVPADKAVTIGVINIFSQDEESPLIEFPEEGFSASKCLINGEEAVFADYIAENGIDTKLPLVGDYSGNGVNISFKSTYDGVVNFYAPVFSGIKYRIAKPISNYAEEFNSHLSDFRDTDAVFSCNCILNFLYGELDGKSIERFNGPITFGEIAYQLVNQTLVYVSVL